MKWTWLPRSRILTPSWWRYRIAVEVGGPLLELGEVFDALQRPLRTEEPLNVHPAERRRVDAMAEFLWADVADEVRRGVRVAVHVAVEAGHTAVRFLGPSIRGHVVLLLRERRDEQAQTFQLLRIQRALEQLLEVIDRDQAPQRCHRVAVVDGVVGRSCVDHQRTGHQVDHWFQTRECHHLRTRGEH
jgi:hypothetical protein